MSNYHIPVMLEEVLEYLVIKPDEWYVDCNLGGGGHTKGILEKGGKVLGIDLDLEAIEEVGRDLRLEVGSGKLEGGEGSWRVEVRDERVILARGNFTHLKEIVGELGIEPKGILFDLGVSSHQLEVAERGFSFNLDAPLDMRMDKSMGVRAADLVNGLHERELSELFWKFGEERFARVIAKRIVSYRESKRIESTDELAQIILSVRRRGKGDRMHPATRVFQALRIVVNDELNSLMTTLPQALDVLKKEGRVVIISFHSLEDRIVKNFLKEEETRGKVRILTKKPILPMEIEISKNARSRSGKLRVAEKV